MKVREVMTRSPSVCLPDTGLAEVAKLMLGCDCGAIPVVSDVGTRKPLGIITDRDIVVRALAHGRNPLEMCARDCMTAPAISVSEDTSVEDCLNMLEDKQIRRILVCDADGAVAGIIAQADLAVNVSKKDAGELVKKISQPAAHA